MLFKDNGHKLYVSDNEAYALNKMYSVKSFYFFNDIAVFLLRGFGLVAYDRKSEREKWSVSFEEIKKNNFFHDDVRKKNISPYFNFMKCYSLNSKGGKVSYQLKYQENEFWFSQNLYVSNSDCYFVKKNGDLVLGYLTEEDNSRRESEGGYIRDGDFFITGCFFQEDYKKEKYAIHVEIIAGGKSIKKHLCSLDISSGDLLHLAEGQIDLGR